jgi:2-dehydropantoate 2-reductase
VANQPSEGSERLEYLIIGAGGTGGSLGGFMAQAGKQVTLVARGAHLEAMRRNGLSLRTVSRGDFTVRPIRCADMSGYRGCPDVIFNCVKGYSLEETLPFIRRVAHPGTVVIPLLNLYGTGGRMQERLPECLVTDGCIYIAAEIQEPGVILQKGGIFRVVFGVRDPAEARPELGQVAQDLRDSGISGELSEDIRRDALLKFSFVSPMAGCGAYFDQPAAAMQAPGEVRDTFIALVREIDRVAEALGIRFQRDPVEVNLAILDALSPDASTSLHRDLSQGRQSEIDGLMFEVVRLGRRHGVPTPVYAKLAERFGFRG